MSSIEEKISYALDSKDLIKESIIDQGVEVSDQDTLRLYASKISEISGGGSGSRANDYSTTETEIGKWINNEPLYRIVITNDTAGTINKDISYLNIKEVIHSDCCFVNGSDCGLVSCNSGYLDRCMYFSNNNKILIFNPASAFIKTESVKYFILEYTKNI